MNRKPPIRAFDALDNIEKIRGSEYAADLHAATRLLAMNDMIIGANDKKFAKKALLTLRNALAEYFVKTRGIDPVDFQAVSKLLLKDWESSNADLR